MRNFYKRDFDFYNDVLIQLNKGPVNCECVFMGATGFPSYVKMFFRNLSCGARLAVINSGNNYLSLVVERQDSGHTYLDTFYCESPDRFGSFFHKSESDMKNIVTLLNNISKACVDAMIKTPDFMWGKYTKQDAESSELSMSLDKANTDLEEVQKLVKTFLDGAVSESIFNASVVGGVYRVISAEGERVYQFAPILKNVFPSVSSLYANKVVLTDSTGERIDLGFLSGYELTDSDKVIGHVAREAVYSTKSLGEVKEYNFHA